MLKHRKNSKCYSTKKYDWKVSEKRNSTHYSSDDKRFEYVKGGKAFIVIPN